MAFDRQLRALEQIRTHARTLVHTLGGGHPASIQAMVALCAAQRDVAVLAGDSAKLDECIPAAELATVYASATFGPRHYISLTARANFALTKFEYARLVSADTLDGCLTQLQDSANALVRNLGERHPLAISGAANSAVGMLEVARTNAARTGDELIAFEGSTQP